MTAAARTDLRRGACPGLSTPMQTGDGLLARLMPTGTISLDAMAGLSAAALRYGNRIIEITSRGSIQVRGLTHESAPAFAAAVAALGIPAQDGVPVIADPLAGLDPNEVIDAGTLAEELRQHLVMRGLVPRIHALAASQKDVDGRDKPGHDESGRRLVLNPKISIAIDGGGSLHLDALPTDIRLRAVATPDGPRLHVAAGGDAASATPLGTIAPADAIDTVMRLLREIAAHGPEARGRDAIRAVPMEAAAPAPARAPVEPIGPHGLRSHKMAVGLGFPFGHTDTGLLNSLLRAAREADATGVRTAPGRTLLFVGLTRPDAANFTAAARRLDFITEPRDPRRRVIACAGAPICASGEIEARELAPAVAQAAIRLTRPNEIIHISGCAKRCAHQGVATYTVIGCAGACDLVVEGAPAGSCETWQLARRLGQIVFDRLPKPTS
jgi:precorrin-3B synthase